MTSLNALIVRAQEVGRYAADLAHGNPEDTASGGAALPFDPDERPTAITGGAHHPGDDTGKLVLEAYRNYGVEAMRDVVRGYQGGYNARAADLGDYVVRWPEIKKGIGWALPGATQEEQRAISDSL